MAYITILHRKDKTFYMKSLIFHNFCIGTVYNLLPERKRDLYYQDFVVQNLSEWYNTVTVRKVKELGCMERDSVIKILQEYYNEKSEVEFAYLFGSYAKGKNNHNSDVDVAVYLNENFDGEFFEYNFDEICKLQELLRKNADIVILNSAEPLLVHQVFRYGILIKGFGNRVLSEFRRLNFYKYLDQMHISKIIFEKNKQRIKESVQGG